MNFLGKYNVKIFDMEESSLKDNEKVERKENLMGDLNILNTSNNAYNSKILEISENIKIFSSDICGLGKSFKIKKLKKEKKELLIYKYKSLI